MPIKQLEYPRFQAIDGNGNPLAGGKVYTYVAGTVSTALTTWTDSAKTSANTNPVILDADGEANIWFDAPIKIKLDDANDVQQWTIDNIPPNASPTASGVYNLIQNGSFEISDTEATNWTLAASTNGTIAVDTTDHVHGSNSLKFTGTDSGGGGTATSAKFAVQPTNGYMVGFVYKSNSATSLNSVQIKWYNAAGAALSTDTLYSEGASTPTTYTTYRRLAYAPANAIEAEIIINGVASGGTTTTAASNFDNIIVSEQCAIDQTGVVSPVNYIKAKNSATGSPVVLIPAGTDTNINLQLDGKGSGFVDLVTWGVNGTQVTAPAAKLNYNDITTLGTVEASKTVTADANRDIANIRYAYTERLYIGDVGGYAGYIDYNAGSLKITPYDDAADQTAREFGYDATNNRWYFETDLATNVVGDVKAADGTTVLDSGTDGTDATFTGDVTGNVTGNVSGDLTGDVTFSGGGTQLAYYQQGTWTPTILDSSNNPSEGQTYGPAEGTYTRIGNIVTIHALITIASIGTLTGTDQVRFGGLPFTSEAGGPGNRSGGVNVIDSNGLGLAGIYPIYGVIESNSTLIYFEKQDTAASSSAMTVAEMHPGGTSALRFWGIYRV